MGKLNPFSESFTQGFGAGCLLRGRLWELRSLVASNRGLGEAIIRHRTRLLGHGVYHVPFFRVGSPYAFMSTRWCIECWVWPGVWWTHAEFYKSYVGRLQDSSRDRELGNIRVSARAVPSSLISVAPSHRKARSEAYAPALCWFAGPSVVGACRSPGKGVFRSLANLGLAVNRDRSSCALRGGHLYGPFVGSGDIVLIELGVLWLLEFKMVRGDALKHPGSRYVNGRGRFLNFSYVTPCNGEWLYYLSCNSQPPVWCSILVFVEWWLPENGENDSTLRRVRWFAWKLITHCYQIPMIR